MKKMMFALVALSTVLAFAAEPFKVDPKAAAAHKAKMLKRTGGYVVKPGKGFVAIVNRQQKADAKAISEAIAPVLKYGRIDIRIVTDEKDAKDAGMVVRLLDEPGKPVLLVAPESWWAEVNVAALTPDLPTEDAKRKFFVPRFQKEILRAFAYAAGAGGSSFNGNVLDVTDIRDLDHVQAVLPVDALDMAIDHLAKRGVTQAEQMSYRTACKEGWAAAPTNDVQKAVWDEVHALPSKPLQLTK